jgi:hypothetical protein
MADLPLAPQAVLSASRRRTPFPTGPMFLVSSEPSPTRLKSARKKWVVVIWESQLMITVEQAKIARQLLRWSQEKLAFEAQLRQASIAAFETGARTSEYTISCIRRALENAGIEFTSESINLRGKQSDRSSPAT